MAFGAFLAKRKTHSVAAPKNNEDNGNLALERILAATFPMRQCSITKDKQMSISRAFPIVLRFKLSAKEAKNEKISATFYCA